MSEPAAKNWLSMADVGRLYEVSRSTVWDWFRRGSRPHGGGDRVRLRMQRVGGLWKTRTQWLDEWRRSLEGGARDGREASPAAQARQAKKDREELARKLAGPGGKGGAG